MEYARIGFANAGPIAEGTIHRHKMSVFVGPNNSGKTIAAKIIHGVCQAAAPSRRRRPVPAGVSLPSDKRGRDALDSAADAMTVLRHAGLRPDDAPTHGRKTSSLSVHNQRGSKRRLDLASARENPLARSISLSRDQGTDDAKRSVYLPATRAGGTQYILNTIRMIGSIAHMQSSLIDQIMTAAETIGENITRTTPFTDTGQILREFTLGDTTQYIEIIGEVLKDGLDPKAQATFGRLFPGSIQVGERWGLPVITYEDPSGHSADIGSAGSGVASLLALVAGMHHVEQGGTFIVEEPESHLEPQRQLALVDEVLRAADENGIGVVVTTQSDFLVQKVLSLVSSGRLDQSDLGLYYFNRPPGSLTRIQRLRVDKTGEAEQEMFTKAIDSLIAGFSG